MREYPVSIKQETNVYGLVCYGIYGLVQLRQKPQAAFRSISYLGLIGVGVCSAGYHMTLKYHTQMCMFSSQLMIYHPSWWLWLTIFKLQTSSG